MTGRHPTADHAFRNPGEASISYHPIEAETQDGKRRLLIDPMENVLIGSILIRKYLGISSVNTMYQWHEKYGLPIMKRPDGQWMTTMTAIDEWMFFGSELERTKRPFPRSTSVSPEEQLLRAQRRLEAAELRKSGMSSAEAYQHMRDKYVPRKKRSVSEPGNSSST